MGWWIEDSLVDSLDKWVSGWVFRMELAPLAEFLLTYPGTWFGLPTSAWGLVPMGITWCSEFRNLPGNAEYLPSMLVSSSSPTAVQALLIRAGLGSPQSLQFLVLALVPSMVWALTHGHYLVRGRFVETYTMTKARIRFFCFGYSDLTSTSTPWCPQPNSLFFWPTTST